MAEAPSDDMTNADEILQSALSTAFTPISITKPSDSQSSSDINPSENVASAPTPAPLVSAEEMALYRAEAEEQARRTQERAAEEREAAASRREAFERVRAGASWADVGIAEQEYGVAQNISTKDSEIRGPPNPIFASAVEVVNIQSDEAQEKEREGEGVSTTETAEPGEGVEAKGYPGSPSPVDVRDRVTSEPAGIAHAKETSEAATHIESHTLEQSQRWEEIGSVRSMESSFPSLSFPDTTESHASSPQGPSRLHTIPSVQPQEHPPSSSAPKESSSVIRPAQPPSATLSIFDAHRSTRARALALVGSLAINLFLPFVNGVMLGFGEIFARSLALRWGWWRPPQTTVGGAATALGVGAVAQRR